MQIPLERLGVEPDEAAGPVLAAPEIPPAGNAEQTIADALMQETSIAPAEWAGFSGRIPHDRRLLAGLLSKLCAWHSLACRG